MVATKTTSTISATVSQTTLVAGIKTAMQNAGFSAIPYDDYTSTNRILVYEWVVDSTKTYGKIYFVISITSALVVSTQLYATWNASTHTGTGGNTVQNFTAFSSASAITCTAFNGGTEYGLVQMVQGSVIVPLGLLIPSSKPTWWDLNLWTYGFMCPNTNWSTWRGSSINPYSNEGYVSFLNNTALGTANPQSARRDVLLGLVLLSSSNSGVAAKTSDDFASVAASGANRYDSIQPQNTSQQYCIINNVAGGLAIRVQ